MAFCAECTYAVGAYRGNVRSLIKDLELRKFLKITQV